MSNRLEFYTEAAAANYLYFNCYNVRNGHVFHNYYARKVALLHCHNGKYFVEITK